MERFSIALMGDVMLGRGVNGALGTMSPEEPWGNVLPLLKESDVRVINLECALTDSVEPWRRTEKVFHFRADPSLAIPALQAAGIQLCSLANNHILDFEEQGLFDTIHHLQVAQIAHAGAGRNLARARLPALTQVKRNGSVKVALVAFTDNEPAFAAGNEHSGSNFLEISLRDEAIESVREAIDQARAEGAQVVIFSNHWGPNQVERPSWLFRRFAHAVMDQGADIYYGHSAHLFQGVEIYRGKPIFYDTGDFIDDYVVDPVTRNDWSFLFRVFWEEEGLHRLELHPVTLSYARVLRAFGQERDQILEKMIGLSSELGTRLQARDGVLHWSAQGKPESARQRRQPQQKKRRHGSG